MSFLRSLASGRRLLVQTGRQLGLLPPPVRTPGGTFLICSPPAVTDGLRVAIQRTAPRSSAVLRQGVRSPGDVALVVEAASAAGLPQLADVIPDGVYQSVAQHDMYSVLFNTGATLAADGYKGHGDAASKTLLGPRGTGKSTALRAYATVAPLFEPNLIPIYANYIGLAGGEEGAEAVYMKQNSLLRTVSDALAVHNITVDASLDSLVEGLRRHNKYALLLLDEVDKFYESPGDASASNVAAMFATERQTLGELASLGNDARGRVAVMLCGSSSLLGDLVNCNLRGTPGAVVDYPVLQVAININGQKFRTTRLTYSPPTNFEAVASMLRKPYTAVARAPPSGAISVLRPHDSELRFDAIVNALLFCAGATARNVSRLITPKVPLTATDHLRPLLVEDSPLAARTLRRPGAKALYSGIMRALCDKNAAVLEALMTPEGDALSFEAISSGAWRHGLQPLSWDEVVHAGGGMPDVEFEAAHLFDRDYIAYGDGMQDGHPCLVYPYTVLQLVRFSKAGATLPFRMLEPIVDGFNAPGLRGADGPVKALRDGVAREAGKDLYDRGMESLRDLASRLSDASGDDAPPPLDPFF